MNEISDAALSSMLRRQMTVAAAKQVTAASNLANASTPGYKAREVDFARALDDSLASGLAITHAKHLQSPEAAGAPTKISEGLQARRDGNTVQIDRELLAVARAGGDFARAQTALAAKFRMVRYALTEGR